MLELAKENLIEIVQNEALGPIYLKAKASAETDDDSAPLAAAAAE
jgi:segregation and condensation protein A